MNLTLHVWRQVGPEHSGAFETHQATNVSPDMSFLEMLPSRSSTTAGRGFVVRAG